MKTNLILNPGPSWAIQALGRKALWLRINRALAWALLTSPVWHWLLGTSFGAGLLVDLWLLLAHGALSLVLFGKPKIPPGSMPLANWALGITPQQASARARFLMTGWKVVLAVFYVGVGWVFLAWLNPVAGSSGWVILWMFFWAMRLPFSTWGHVNGAGAYAALRWKWAPNLAAARDWGALLVVLSIAGNLLTLARAA